LRATINGAGATMTAIAVVVFLSTKFLAGAWVVTIAIPLLMFLFWKIESYYQKVASEIQLGETPELPLRRNSIVVVPTTTVTLLTERALSAALSLGDRVVAVAVAGDEAEQDEIRRQWRRWNCAVPIEILLDPHRSLVRSVLRYVDGLKGEDALITVLIPEIVPSKRRHEILHNQRGWLLESALKSRTDGVVVATLPFHIHD
jgi:hypothetical protein